MSSREDRVSLTFDDGPDPTWTPVILRALARLGALATVRRFDMAWMMAGKAEKKAASSLFLAAAVSDPCAELAEAAKKYGVEI